MKTKFANNLELDITTAKSQKSNCFYRWIMRKIDSRYNNCSIITHTWQKHAPIQIRVLFSLTLFWGQIKNANEFEADRFEIPKTRKKKQSHSSNARHLDMESRARRKKKGTHVWIQEQVSNGCESLLICAFGQHSNYRVLRCCQLSDEKKTKIKRIGNCTNHRINWFRMKCSDQPNNEMCKKKHSSLVYDEQIKRRVFTEPENEREEEEKNERL